MRNLIGYLKKTLLLFSTLFLLSFFPTKTFAQVDVETSAVFEHEIIGKEIRTRATISISSTTPKVVSYYTTAFPIKNLQVKCYNGRTQKVIECSTYQKTSSTEILFDLQNAVVKSDLPFILLVTYTTTTENNNSYQIPSYITDTETSKIIITYPIDKGVPLWSSDTIQNLKKIGNSKYQIEMVNPIYETASILFGENLLYKFDINRVFTNSLSDENQTFELIVPPDTYNQSIIWESFSPMPNSAIKDEDGNYIFKYVVPPNESINCSIKGYIYKNESVEDSEGISSLYTKKIGYWNITESAEYRRINSYISKNAFSIPNDFASVDILSESQKEVFVRYIYRYVIERLHFDKDIELGLGEEKRVGATSILDKPANATPVDYADFLITILRNYDIPARMVIGYVSNISGYTSDGFYHYWVEYYDSTNNKWEILDPFMEDYFEKSFFKSQFSDHLTILRRGKNPLSPNITFYQDNDFTVTATPDVDLKPEFKFTSELVFDKAVITNTYTKGYIYISNTGNIALSDYEILKSNI
ncbi:MAG: transglutaminase domain-containing protein, partial [Candidatus Dojkabacteria bacterium]|nr:transglutaminase domain-containing protein [Candidatus Dojkabacteria bacterium]